MNKLINQRLAWARLRRLVHPKEQKSAHIAEFSLLVLTSVFQNPRLFDSKIKKNLPSNIDKILISEW